MCSYVNKASKEERKPAAVYDYNLNMGAVDLQDQMLRSYLLERKKGSRWHMKLFKRLVNTAGHNSLKIYSSMPNNKVKDPMKLGPSDTRSHAEAQACCQSRRIWQSFN
jgi:predicted cupin superfamily sugar epimerase